MIEPTFNVSIRDDRRAKIQHLILEGDLGVKHIEKLKARIDTFDFKRSEIDIHLKAIESFDLSTAQLLYSLRKSLSQTGKRIKINSDLPDVIDKILRNTGFEDLLNLENSLNK